MRIIKTEILTLEQKQSLFQLWNSEYPISICYSDISQFKNYLNGLFNKNHYLLVDDENQILGWTYTFVRDDENWFAILLNYKMQCKGFGTILLNELKNNNTVLNGWVIDYPNELKQNKEPYVSPIKFYIKNNFYIESSSRLENETISAVKIKWEK